MLGLSITAIGKRDFKDCVRIYENLKPVLGLEFLELAVGSRCDLSQLDTDRPLVIHNNCLFNEGGRLSLSLLNRKSWREYREHISSHNVLFISIHPPMRYLCSLSELKRKRDEMEEFFNLPVCIEVMEDPNRWLSLTDFNDNFKELATILLLIDVSHVNIWTKNNHRLTQEWTERLMPNAIAIHLSHNRGRRDSHDLIPKGIWFNYYLKDWEREGKYITYESLPQDLKQYQRLDKQLA